MSTSLIYRSAHVYELLMRGLYGRHYAARMRTVAEQVPPGASVLELCCGPGTLYRRYLRPRVDGYIGLDINPGFVARLRRDGIDARRFDLAQDGRPLPAADVVIIQASLYHFLPDAAALIDRMLAAARRLVVVSEPIRNLSSSGLPLIGRLGRRAADPGVGGHQQRFDEPALDALMSRYRDRTLSALSIPGAREKIYVLAPATAGRAGPTPPDDRSGTAAGP
ncbi:MAG: class I SAM-dependent methyltransferase [Actinomycetota bacterium]|nr:class I SAM-dependent methyltransferase [Actinomycetota bacterium]